MVFIYRKRTKKTTPRPGRKKAKKDQPPTDQGTLRTRAAMARVAATKAAREAAEAAEQAERHLLDVPPLETIPPSSPRTPPSLDLQIVNQIEDMPADGAPRKMTPRRKQLASKVRKESRKEDSSKEREEKVKHLNM